MNLIGHGFMLGSCVAREVCLPAGPHPFSEARIPFGYPKTKRGCRAGVKVKATQRSKQYSISTIERPRCDRYRTTIRTFNRDLLIPLQRKTNGTSFPRIFFSNARSMVNKLDDICRTVTSNLCDIAVISESWLSSRVPDQLISIPGYATFRRDRSDDQRGGGLCTFISTRLNFVELRELSDFNIESQWFVIKPDRLSRGINSIVLGTVYHPPQSDDNILRAHLFNCLDSSLAAHPHSAIIVLGDFNKFKPAALCSLFKLKKLVTKPTRGNNILDQAFSTLSNYYNDLSLPPLGLSDHSSINHSAQETCHETNKRQ